MHAALDSVVNPHLAVAGIAAGLCIQYCRDINKYGLKSKIHNRAIVGNVVTYVYAKFGVDRLWNEKAPTGTTLVAIGDRSRVWNLSNIYRPIAKQTASVKVNMN